MSRREFIETDDLTDSHSGNAKSGNMHALIDSAAIRTWMICEQGDRWQTATRRFITDLMPRDLVAAISPTDWDTAQRFAPVPATKGGLVLLWEVSPENLATAMETITGVSTIAPHALQLVAQQRLSSAEQAGLLELGVKTIIQAPEQLPSLRSLIHAYFRRRA